MATYAVIYDIEQQPTYNRVHVVIRIAILILLSIIAGAVGWIFGIAYLAVPVLAAILIAQKGSRRYLDEAEGNMLMWLRYLFAFYAYLGLLTDKLPNEDPKTYMRMDLQPEGESSAGAVLLRIILAIPHAIVLGLLGIVAVILVIVAAIMVLIQEKYPQGIFDFLRGYARWNARMYGYLAGFSDKYPPFALDTGPEGGTAAMVSAPPPEVPPAAGQSQQP